MYSSRHRSPGPFLEGSGRRSPISPIRNFRESSGVNYGIGYSTRVYGDNHFSSSKAPLNPSLSRVKGLDCGRSDVPLRTRDCSLDRSRNGEFVGSAGRLTSLRPPPPPVSFFGDNLLSNSTRRRDTGTSSPTSFESRIPCSLPCSPSTPRKHIPLSDSIISKNVRYGTEDSWLNYKDGINLANTKPKNENYFDFSSKSLMKYSSPYSSAYRSNLRRTDYSEYIRPILQDRPMLKANYTPRSRAERDSSVCVPLNRDRKMIKFRELGKDIPTNVRRKISWVLADDMESPLINELRQIDAQFRADQNIRSRESSLTRVPSKEGSVTLQSPRASVRNYSRDSSLTRLSSPSRFEDTSENSQSRQSSLTCRNSASDKRSFQSSKSSLSRVQSPRKYRNDYQPRNFNSLYSNENESTASQYTRNGCRVSKDDISNDNEIINSSASIKSTTKINGYLSAKDQLAVGGGSSCILAECKRDIEASKLTAFAMLPQNNADDVKRPCDDGEMHTNLSYHERIESCESKEDYRPGRRRRRHLPSTIEESLEVKYRSAKGSQDINNESKARCRSRTRAAVTNSNGTACSAIYDSPNLIEDELNKQNKQPTINHSFRQSIRYNKSTNPSTALTISEDLDINTCPQSSELKQTPRNRLISPNLLHQKEIMTPKEKNSKSINEVKSEKDKFQQINSTDLRHNHNSSENFKAVALQSNQMPANKIDSSVAHLTEPKKTKTTLLDISSSSTATFKDSSKNSNDMNACISTCKAEEKHKLASISSARPVKAEAEVSKSIVSSTNKSLTQEENPCQLGYTCPTTSSTPMEIAVITDTKKVLQSDVEEMVIVCKLPPPKWSKKTNTSISDTNKTGVKKKSNSQYLAKSAHQVDKKTSDAKSSILKGQNKVSEIPKNECKFDMDSENLITISIAEKETYTTDITVAVEIDFSLIKKNVNDAKSSQSQEIKPSTVQRSISSDGTTVVPIYKKTTNSDSSISEISDQIRKAAIPSAMYAANNDSRKSKTDTKLIKEISIIETPPLSNKVAHTPTTKPLSPPPATKPPVAKPVTPPPVAKPVTPPPVAKPVTPPPVAKPVSPPPVAKPVVPPPLAMTKPVTPPPLSVTKPVAPPPVTSVTAPVPAKPLTPPPAAKPLTPPPAARPLIPSSLPVTKPVAPPPLPVTKSVAPPPLPVTKSVAPPPLPVTKPPSSQTSITQSSSTAPIPAKPLTPPPAAEPANLKSDVFETTTCVTKQKFALNDKQEPPVVSESNEHPPETQPLSRITQISETSTATIPDSPTSVGKPKSSTSVVTRERPDSAMKQEPCITGKLKNFAKVMKPEPPTIPKADISAKSDIPITTEFKYPNTVSEMPRIEQQSVKNILPTPQSEISKNSNLKQTLPTCPGTKMLGLFIKPKEAKKPVPETITESSSEEESEDDPDEETNNASNTVCESVSTRIVPDKGISRNKDIENQHKISDISSKGKSEGEERSRTKSQLSTTSIDSNISSSTTYSSISASSDISTICEDLSQSSVRSPEKKSKLRFRKYAIGDFNFLKLLGKGSFGKVLLAELKDYEMYFAIKCLKKDVVLEDDDVECTMIERRVLALGTQHPYMCKLYCTFQTDSHLCFVMEYLNGGDLMFHIQESGRFEQNRAMFYGAEIVSALKFLHKKGIVYRDIKLDNVVLDEQGHIRLVDFGMCQCRIYREECMPFNFCGTPQYIAPEIITGQKYNQSVDWWSFGILLYEMLTGQSPFNGTDEDELFWSICNEEPHYPRFLTKEARHILGLLMSKNPSNRLGMPSCSAGDIADHAFFSSINWGKLEKKQIHPPFKPSVRFASDTSNFDSNFTMDSATLTPVETDILESMDQQQFKGFSYTNPHITG